MRFYKKWPWIICSSVTIFFSNNASKNGVPVQGRPIIRYAGYPMLYIWLIPSSNIQDETQNAINRGAFVTHDIAQNNIQHRNQGIFLV